MPGLVPKKGVSLVKLAGDQGGCMARIGVSLNV